MEIRGLEGSGGCRGREVGGQAVGGRRLGVGGRLKVGGGFCFFNY